MNAETKYNYVILIYCNYLLYIIKPQSICNNPNIPDIKYITCSVLSTSILPSPLIMLCPKSINNAIIIPAVLAANNLFVCFSNDGIVGSDGVLCST